MWTHVSVTLCMCACLCVCANVYIYHSMTHKPHQRLCSRKLRQHSFKAEANTDRAERATGTTHAHAHTHTHKHARTHAYTLMHMLILTLSNSHWKSPFVHLNELNLGLFETWNTNLKFNYDCVSFSNHLINSKVRHVIFFFFSQDNKHKNVSEMSDIYNKH